MLTDLGVIMVDRPTAISLDTHHRLHNEQAPSLTYADGWSVWALGGLGVPRVAVEDPGSLTVAGIQRVAHPSRHLALIGIYGHDRYVEAIAGSPDLLANEIDAGVARPALAALGETPFIQKRGHVIHADPDALGQPRRLWRAARRSDEALVMLEVVNSTAEPDGTYHHYYLRVPPRMLTCRDAVAWTFGLAGPQYAPLVES